MAEPGPADSIAESSAPAAEFLVEPGPADSIAESSAPEFLVEPGPAAESSAPVAPSDPNAVAAAAAERPVAGDSPGPGHADVNVLSPSQRKWIWRSPQKRNAAASSSSARPADSFNQPPGPAEIVPRLPISVCF